MVRERILTQQSALVQTAMDLSSEALKAKKSKKINKKAITIRYVNGIKFYPDSHRISFTTVQDGLVYLVARLPLIDKYRGEYTISQLIIDERMNRIFIMDQVKISVKEVMKKEEVKVLGIERGIKNIVIMSNSMFFISRHLREVKERYKYLKRILLHLGTFQMKENGHSKKI